MIQSRSLIAFVIGVFFIFSSSASAEVVGWGAQTDNSTHSSCPSFCSVPPGVIFRNSDGGEFATSAASSLSDSSGVSNAEATLSGTSFTPILKAFASSQPSAGAIPGTRAFVSTVGAQGYTYSGPGETITLDLVLEVILDETAVGSPRANATARVAVIFANDLDFLTDFGTLVFEAAPAGSVKAQTSMFANIDSGMQGPVSVIDTLSFDVVTGDEFLVWSGLEADAFRGGIADAFNTLTMSFNEAARRSLAAASAPETNAGGLDHFKCYEAEGDDHLDISIDLEDQFDHGPVRSEVEEPELFCNPVDKNGEGIFDDTAHLTGYELDDDDDDDDGFESRTITISNQFGDNQTLVIEEPKLLLVPSEKDGVASALDLDYFKCYEVEDGNDPGISPVSLLDQFGLELVAVEEPELFCNPVDKNGGGILDDTAHLTCYEIEADDADQGVSVINQLPDNQWLKLEEAELLCVPSELLATGVVPLPPEGDDDEEDVDGDDETGGEDDDDDPDGRGRIGSISIYWLLALGMIGVIRARNRKI